MLQAVVVNEGDDGICGIIFQILLAEDCRKFLVAWVKGCLYYRLGCDRNGAGGDGLCGLGPGGRCCTSLSECNFAYRHANWA